MEAPEPEFSAAPFASPDRCNPLDGNPNKPPSCDQFLVEDLLDFPSDDADCCTFDNATGSSTDSSTVTASGGLSALEPSFNGGISDAGLTDGQFSAELCVPYDDMAELEWLSNFVEESFSSEDQQNLHVISGMSSRRTDEASETTVDEYHPNQGCGGGSSSPMFHSDMTVPAKARSKRSRTAPCNWASCHLVVSSEASSPEDGTLIVNAAEPPPPLVPPQQSIVVVPSGGKKTARSTPNKRNPAEVLRNDGADPGRETRRCLHCATDTTPQWRTGPMGPKTLCNACGVRYKSGRLVPEYRPAASPTFVLTKHSNSHRKVLELRRQKEMMRAAHQQFQQPHHHQLPPLLPNDMGFDAASSEEDGYLIHQHVCPDFQHLI